MSAKPSPLRLQNRIVEDRKRADERLHRRISGFGMANASVMPRIITGPGTNASTHMIAGRAAELIAG